MKFYEDTTLRFLITVFVALTATGFIGCTNKAAQQGFDRPPAPVSVTAAVMQDVPTYLDSIGKTVAREVVSIQPQVSGRITKINFSDGANVRKGDLLFTIDTRPFEANLRQAEANVSKDLALKKQAEANLARDVAQAKWGEVQVKRYGELVKGGVITGKITDVEGRPLIEEWVYLFDAEPALKQTAEKIGNVRVRDGQTDDRGIYRIFGVAAGRYKVAVGNDGGNLRWRSVARRYRRVFFSGVGLQSRREQSNQ